jgi:hypothetical protein
MARTQKISKDDAQYISERTYSILDLNLPYIEDAHKPAYADQLAEAQRRMGLLVAEFGLKAVVAHQDNDFNEAMHCKGIADLVWNL